MTRRKLKIELVRVYDAEAMEVDGYRVLVDRLWPRGIKKADLKFDVWMKEIAPSNELRKWFGHDPERYEEFVKRYFQELAEKDDLIAELLEQAKKQPLLLLFAAKDTQYNNAVALKKYLREQANEGKPNA